MATSPNHPVRILGTDFDIRRLNEIAQQVQERRHELEKVDEAVKTLQSFIETVPSKPQPQTATLPAATTTETQPQQPKSTGHQPSNKPRGMSEESKKKLSRKMKGIWRERKKGNKPTTKKKAKASSKKARTGRPLTQTAKAKISASQKERWRQRRAAEQQKQQPAAAAPTATTPTDSPQVAA